VRDPRHVIVSIYFEKYRHLKTYTTGEKLEHPIVAERVEPFQGDLSSYLYEEIGGYSEYLTDDEITFLTIRMKEMLSAYFG